MTDSLIHQLQRRYPCVDWHPNGFGCRGTSESGAVFAVSPVIRGGRYSGEWIAAAAPRSGAVPNVVRDYHDAFSALDALRQLGGEHMAALEPVDDYSRAQEPQRRPFPAVGLWWLGKGCLWVLVDVARELLPSRWHLLLFGMALACGALGMWWLTGGAP